MTSQRNEDATDLAARLRAGEVSSVDVTRASLARIDELDADLNAFITVDTDGPSPPQSISTAGAGTACPAGLCTGCPWQSRM